MIKILAQVFTVVGKVVNFFHHLDEKILNFVLDVVAKVGAHNE